jgi:hypothetical protein
MTRNASVRLLFATALVALALACAPAAALAVGQPAFAPAAIFSEGFEGALPPRVSLAWAMPTPGDPTPAYWGPVTQRKHTGSFGLWCAGAIPGSAANGWTTYGGVYPVYTAGLATFDVPEMADYYSATLDYWYSLPSRGANDDASFNVMWSTAAAPDHWQPDAAQPLAATMTERTYALTLPSLGSGHPVNLSRMAGRVRFLFIDDVSDYESPARGEGPTIDDVIVYGYKYGPVRALQTSSVTSQAVVLSWSRPASSTALLSGDDTRPSFRVWRARDAQPYSWIELTGARVTGTSFEDTRPVGGNVRYIVQAWDPGSGTGYGQVEASTGVSVFVDKAPESTIVLDPASPPGPDGYVVAPTVTVSREFEGLTYWRWDTGAYSSSAASSFQVAVPTSFATTRTIEVYSANSLGTPETPHKTVSFAMKTYRLQYAAGAGGAVSGTATQTVNYGGSGTLVTASPGAGHHFVAWSDGVATASRTDTGITTDLLVSANFELDTYQLHYSAGTGGSVSGATSQTVSWGGSGSAVTAVPSTGYHFVAWSDGFPTAARTDIAVTGNVTATASFAINTYQLHYSAGTGGTISGTASQTVNYGGSGTSVTATPTAGHHFVAWSDGLTTATRTDSGVVASLTVSAVFGVNAPGTRTLTYTAGAGGTISGTASQTVTVGGSGTEVTAVAGAGYHFVRWSDGVTTAARTDHDVTVDVLVSASFAINTYQLHYSAGVGGTISGTASQTVNHGGSGTAVTALPSTGYHFVAWSDGHPTAARTDSGVVGNVSASATFALNTYQLHYSAGSGGTISGTASQTVNYGGSGTAVTATPTAGYHFVAWSDGVPTAARTDSGVTDAITVTAVFAIGEPDTAPPVTTWPGWAATFITRATIVLSAADGYGTGVASTYYRLDGGAETTYTAAFSVTKTGAHTLEFWSVDRAGNVESFHTATFTVLIATSVSITSDHTSASYGHAIVFSGHVSSNISTNSHVEVWAKKPGSSTWVKLSTRHSTSTHHWSYTYAPPAKGTWYFQVRYAGTSKYGPSTSSSRAVTVKAVATSVSITSNHTTVTSGHPVVFSGHISSNRPRNTDVKVYAKQPGSSTWVYLSTRHTTSTHHWSYTYAPTIKGTWYFQVRYAGTSKYGASTSSSRKITVN